MEINRREEDDQEQVDKALDILMDFLEEHTEFKINIWVSAMCSAISGSFKVSGFSYEEFKEEVQNMTNFYKHRWDEDV